MFLWGLALIHMGLAGATMALIWCHAKVHLSRHRNLVGSKHESSEYPGLMYWSGYHCLGLSLSWILGGWERSESVDLV